MSILFYWRKDDFNQEFDDPCGKFFSKNNQFCDMAKQGENIWAITHSENVVLVGRCFITGKGETEDKGHGKYFVSYDRSKSDILSRDIIDSQAGKFESVLRQTKIRPQWSDNIYDQFQGDNHIILICVHDELLLNVFLTAIK